MTRRIAAALAAMLLSTTLAACCDNKCIKEPPCKPCENPCCPHPAPAPK